MKTCLKNSISILIIAVVLGITAGVSYAQSSEKRNVSGFEEVSVSSGIDLFLKQGSEFFVEVIAEDKDDVERIKTEVSGNKLKIYYKKSGWSFNFNQKLKVRVTMPEIYSVEASGGSDVYGVEVIKSKELSISASGGADVKLDIEVGDLELDASGGADIVLKGKALSVESDCSGGSDIKAYDLHAKKADVNASGGSDIQITVAEEFYADASGGSDVYYKGNPTKIRTDNSSSADIHHVK